MAGIQELFDNYRGEWGSQDFRRYFVEPPYYSKLHLPQPCLLIGGRGTGKTTALKSLTYESMASDSVSVPVDHVGIYIKLNKNRVRAFSGSDLPEEQWAKAFAHYFNLIVLQEFFRLAEWVRKVSLEPAIRPDQCRAFSSAMGIDIQETVEALSSATQSAILKLETFVNNPRQSPQPILSIAEGPVRLVAEELSKTNLLRGRTLFCCIDEYENLLDAQQAVVNTYIKNAEPPLSYKVGIRRGGLRCRHTIDSNDLLATPDDYAEIDISDEGFSAFAGEVLRRRLLLASELHPGISQDPEEFLPSFSRREEALELGAAKVAETVIESAKMGSAERNWLGDCHPADVAFLKFWAESSKMPVETLVRDWRENPRSWTNRLNNYGYSSLFWLSRGRKGARIRKYYCGFSTLVALSGGNIRYFMELVNEACKGDATDDSVRDSGPLAISQRAQTEAAKRVGLRRLDQLEGLSERGRELKRLVLALGKVFFEKARRPESKTPEVSSFVLCGQADAMREIEALLDEGVSHLAFEATPRTKATSPFEMRDAEFRLHPIFCAFFEFSHRRKRRAVFDAALLRMVQKNPRDAIAQLLGEAPQTEPGDLPEQLSMFSAFFDGGSR